MIGAIIGDIVGSVYEFEAFKSKDFPLFSEASHFTDDALLTVAVADCLLRDADPAATIRAWGQQYWKLDYGHHFRRWLMRDHHGPYNSFGNGSAMRVSPAAFLAVNLEDARSKAIRVTEVTHNHPEGIKGALATVDAIWMFLEGKSADTVHEHISVTYAYDLNRTVDDIRPGYEFNESCQGTVPEAIISVLDATDFEDAIRNAVSLGGDADTLACIAGSIAEARFGVPAELAIVAMERIPEALRTVVVSMYARGQRAFPHMGKD